jgi:hypothetical protein
MKRQLRIAALTLPISLCAWAQAPAFRTPGSGFVFDAHSARILPIHGFPGAALLGDPLEAPIAARTLEFAPGQAYAIATDAENRVFLMILGNGNAVQQIPSALAGMSDVKVRFNASGSAAVLYSATARRFQVLTGLPATPTLTDAIDLPELAGEITAMAVDANGSRVLVGVTGEARGAVYLASASAPQLKFLTEARSPSDLAFSAGGNDAVVADRDANAILTVRDLNGKCMVVPLLGEADGVKAPVAIRILDNSQVVVANSASAELMLIDSAFDAAPSLRKLELAQPATRLDRLAIPGSFLLTAVDAGPLLVLDLAKDAAVYFIPNRQF